MGTSMQSAFGIAADGEGTRRTDGALRVNSV
jgi:hypothetical protein